MKLYFLKCIIINEKCAIMKINDHLPYRQFRGPVSEGIMYPRTLFPKESCSPEQYSLRNNVRGTLFPVLAGGNNIP